MNSKGFNGQGPESMYALYQSLLDNSAVQIGTVMHLLAEVKEGAALFHCTAGKDRTGIIAMILLELAGVPKEYIIANYSVTKTYMKDVFARQKKQAEANRIEIKDYMLQSKPEDIERTIEYFHQKYTDAETYLLDKTPEAFLLQNPVLSTVSPFLTEFSQSSKDCFDTLNSLPSPIVRKDIKQLRLFPFFQHFCWCDFVKLTH